LIRSPAPATVKRTLATGERQVAVALRQDVTELGVTFHLLQFRRRLEPATHHPSHFSSRVDVLPREDDKTGRSRFKPMENQLIQMNQPLEFTDPKSGRSYRVFQKEHHGPQTPAELILVPQFTSDQSKEDLIYLSGLSLTYDPGRALKYAGCLLVILGIFLRYFVFGGSGGKGDRHVLRPETGRKTSQSPTSEDAPLAAEPMPAGAGVERGAR
jgi:hypothetical protein